MVKAIDAFVASQAANGLTIVAGGSTATLDIDSSNYFRVPKGTKLGTVCGRGANLARMQLNRSGDQVPILDTTNVAVLAADLIVDEYNQVPFIFPGDEKLSCYVDNSNNPEPQGVTFTHGFILHMFAPNVVTRILRITDTTTAVARTWTTSSATTWPANLPASGKFRIIGMREQEASGHACRVILGEDRPGVPTQHASPAQMLYFSEPFEADFGKLPKFEILSSTNTASRVIELAVEY